MTDQRKSWRLWAICLALSGGASALQAQSIHTTFMYDEVGNRVQALDRIAPDGSTLSSFTPRFGSPGDEVVVFGTDLPVGMPSSVQVAIDGTPATVVSVAPNVVVVQVPIGAATGPMTVTLPGLDPIDLGVFRVESIQLVAAPRWVQMGREFQFGAVLMGVSDPSVLWGVTPPNLSMDDEFELNPGTIAADGRYIAPDRDDSSASPIVVVRATSALRPDLVATSLFHLVGLIPGTSKVCALSPTFGDVDGLSPNISIADPVIDILVPELGDVDGLRVGVFVALPPTSALMPNVGDEHSELNTIMADPPVTTEFEPN